LSLLTAEPLINVQWSCITALKKMQNSPRYEGYPEVRELLGKVMKEIRVGVPIHDEIGVSDRPSGCGGGDSSALSDEQRHI